MGIEGIQNVPEQALQQRVVMLPTQAEKHTQK